MAGERFEPGKVVQLKSGGPNMTIEEDIDGDTCNCQWFEKNELRYGVFKYSSLREPPPPPGPTRLTRG